MLAVIFPWSKAEQNDKVSSVNGKQDVSEAIIIPLALSHIQQ
jgi:hypothetical protein